jgi:hypothetical protein
MQEEKTVYLPLQNRNLSFESVSVGEAHLKSRSGPGGDGGGNE